MITKLYGAIIAALAALFVSPAVTAQDDANATTSPPLTALAECPSDMQQPGEAGDPYCYSLWADDYCSPTIRSASFDMDSCETALYAQPGQLNPTHPPRPEDAPRDVSSSYISPTKGRLNGGEPQTFDLMIYSYEACGGPIAYVGNSEAGNPIILTNEGELELIDRRIALAASRSVYDMETGDDVLHVFRSHQWAANGALTFTPDLNVYEEKKLENGQTICITAPSNQPGRLTHAPAQCGVVGKYRGNAGTERASNEDLAALADSLPQHPNPALAIPAERRGIERVIGTNFLVEVTAEGCV